MIYTVNFDLTIRIEIEAKSEASAAYMALLGLPAEIYHTAGNSLYITVVEKRKEDECKSITQ